jgi:hypothetical protein
LFTENSSFPGSDLWDVAPGGGSLKENPEKRRPEGGVPMASGMLDATAARASLAHHLWRREPDVTDLRLKIGYLGLQVLDLALTLFALSLGAQELNPLLRAAFQSPLQLTVIKVGLPLWLVWILPGRFLIPAVVLLLFVVGWDIKELAALAF